MKIDLKSRTLWFDGSSTFKAEDLDSLISTITDFSKVNVDQMTPDIIHYNNLVPPNERLTVKQDCLLPGIQVKIPEKYTKVVLEDYFLDRVCDEGNPHNSDDWYIERVQRVNHELATFQRRGLEWLLRLMMYIVDQLTVNNQVWGVGRGSSVSSYLLYLIGVHDVDSVFYELDFSDFM